MNVLRKIQSFFHRVGTGNAADDETILHFPPEESLQYRRQNNLTHQTVLKLSEHQAAVIFYNETCTEILTKGEYIINSESLANAEYADILCMNTMVTLKRTWRSHYQPPQRLLQSPLSGNYSVCIINPPKLADMMINNRIIRPETVFSFIDQWVSYRLDELLKAEQISADDIEHQIDMLQKFLSEQLSPDIQQLGLALEQFTVGNYDRNPETEISDNTSQSPPAATEVLPEPYSDTPPEILNRKNFYRVEQGEQIGPLSIIEIQQLINEDKIKPQDLLWQKGMSSWQSAQKFPWFRWH